MVLDFLIIGGGISGFYCALELIKHNKKVCLCEKYADLGGRAITYNQDGYNWEIGAGRISEKHTLVLNLMKKYKQELVPIGSNVFYKNENSECLEENIFETTIDAMFGVLKKLDKEVLGNSTIKELCYKIHGKEKTDEYLIRFPYKAEVEVLRADLGLESFRHEMGSHEGYFVAKHGLSKLIQAMKDDFISKGGIIYTNYECINVKVEDSISCEFLVGKRSLKGSRKKIILQTNKLICAMESENLKKISYFKNLDVLKKIKMEPLLRTYGAFEKPWFSQLPRIVTNSPIRYFLPMNYKKGVAMVSYTDSKDTEIFHNILVKHGEESLGKFIYNQLTNLFGSLPKMIYFKAHYWKYGASYWLPGSYNPTEESQKSLKPFDCEIYLVGESYSLKQAWMEGALEQAEKLFNTYRI
jgi:protoporphyrinogen oxidase